MPAIITLADFLTGSGNEKIVPLVEVASRPVPELTGELIVLNQRTQIPGVPYFRIISGVNYPTLLRTSLPNVSFRPFGGGAANTKSAYQKKTIETFPLAAKVFVDKKMADMDPDGKSAMIVREMAGQIQAVLKHLGRCFYLGNTIDANGYPGLRDQIDATMIVDATGSTADTASTVWAVRWGDQDVSWVFGDEGKWEVSEITEIPDWDDGTGKRLTVYHQEITLMAGLQVLNPTAVACIKNLTAQAGKTLDDDLLGALVDKFPEGMPPNAIYMSGRSRTQLKTSRTATTPDGRAAPTPDNYEGIPLFATSQISNTEAIWP